MEEKNMTEYLKRSLKAWQKTDENAKMFLLLMEYGKNIDAVAIPQDKLGYAKELIPYADMDYMLLKINKQAVLVFPDEERERYEMIREEMLHASPVMVYGPFTYSEALAMKDFMAASDITYKVKTVENGDLFFRVSGNDSEKTNLAMQKVGEEGQTEVGKKQFVSSNICWMHAMKTASDALEQKDTAVICSAGGAGVLKIDQDGAILHTQKGRGRFISRMDMQFDMKVLDAILDDLDGGKAPVKPFYGEYAKELTRDITMASIKKKAPGMKEAVRQLGMETIPSMMDIMISMNPDDYQKTEMETAFYTVLRGAACRETVLDDLREYRMSQQNWKTYNEMHKKNLEEIKGDRKEQRKERGMSDERNRE